MGKVVQLDVRPFHERGEEPFQAIMSAVAGIEPDDTFVLINSFEPKPLYAVLGKRGFQHASREVGPGHWEITFTPGNG